jgi:hypothetical protein
MSQLGVTEEWLNQAVLLVTGHARVRQPAAVVSRIPPLRPRLAADTLAPATATPPPAEPTRDAIALMLARADDSSSRAAKRTAERIRTLITTLRDQLNAVAEADRLAKAEAAEREKVLAEIAAARKALDEANERAKALGLRKSRGTAATVRGSSDNAAIRQWAAEQGLACPARGRVPADIRAAFEAARG